MACAEADGSRGIVNEASETMSFSNDIVENTIIQSPLNPQIPTKSLRTIIEDPTFIFETVFSDEISELEASDLRTFSRKIAVGLEKRARLNSCFAGGINDVFSKFSCVTEPSITLEDYVERLLQYLSTWRTIGYRCAVKALLLSLVYIERIYRLYPSARISSMNVHKILLSTMLVAVKYIEDMPLSNNFWARVGGVDLKELNKLEGDLCALLNFDFYVSKPEIKTSTLRYYI